MKVKTHVELAIEANTFSTTFMLSSLGLTTDTFGRTALHYAAWRGLPDQCHELLKMGASATQSDVYGNTPLHYLCLSFATPATSALPSAHETFQLLVNYGADPEAANQDGRTPRQIAPQAPYFQSLRKRERLEKLGRRQLERKAEAPVRRAM